ncbi:ankyrin repeat domain-containing protein [Cupriavidus basilensis]
MQGLSRGATALHKAALNDNHEVLKELISFGAEIDAGTRTGTRRCTSRQAEASRIRRPW